MTTSKATENQNERSASTRVSRTLVAVEGPAAVIDEILGHSSGAAKEVYGDGLPVEVSARWLRKALGLADKCAQEPSEAMSFT